MLLLSTLKRYPAHKHDLLQAWDSADELILEYMSQLEPQATRRVLILQDHFGALTYGLNNLNPVVYTDSYVSTEAIRLNTQEPVRLIHQLNQLEGLFDLVLARIPKNLAFFEDILYQLSKHLQPQAQIIFGYMIKHQTKKSFALIEKILGPTHTSLAKKKARLIFSKFQQSPKQSPYPTAIPIAGFTHPLLRHSNLFSRDQLDIGTRFLLQHLPIELAGTILDLGCADGIIGIAAQQKNPSAQLIFSDESQMAIQSAQVNYSTYFPEKTAQFFWTHGFKNQPPASVHFILCNPPFHQEHTVGNFIARDLFTHAHHALAPGGTLRVIANRHLEYKKMLRLLFGNCEQIAQNQKFMILDAVRT